MPAIKLPILRKDTKKSIGSKLGSALAASVAVSNGM
jgi:hypothetical protein